MLQPNSPLARLLKPAASSNTPMSQSMKRIQKIGSNRGQPRIWIEGQCLSSMGWNRGQRYECQFHQGRITYTRSDSGSRAVAGYENRPIIDTNSAKIHEALGADAKFIAVEITADTITIRPSAAPPSKLGTAVVAAALFIAALGTPWIARHDLAPKRVLVACEESATVRDAFTRRGHDAISCDLLPTRNPLGWHLQGDVRDLLEQEWDIILGFPPCTFLTNSAEWAYNDPDFIRYPGVGYHQKVKPDTLTGAARRQARQEALAFVLRIWNSCKKVCIENPAGYLSNAFRKPSQIIQPWEHGHPESKTTCLWLKNLPLLKPTNILAIEEHGYLAPNEIWRWRNQTPNGQNNLPPSADRDKIRSTTYPGIGEAMAEQFGGDLS
jgi:hypothetical protein